MKALALLHAGQLVTVAGPNEPRNGAGLRDLGIIQDGGMLMQGGRITRVGPSDEIEKVSAGCEVIDAGGCVVCPGFVDAHTHIVFGGDRLDDFERRTKGETYQEIAAAGGGILSTVRATRNASEASLLTKAQERARWFLRGGTTTIEAKSGYGLNVADELKILRIIRALSETTPLECVPTFLGAHAIPPENDSISYERLLIDEMLPAVTGKALAENADIFCEEGYFNIEQARRILTAAKGAGLKLRMHVDQLTNGGGAALAAEMQSATADHLEKTDARGIAALKAGNVQPVLLPASVYGLGVHHYPSARQMIEAGLAVVVASDFNPGSSPTTSMAMVLSLACSQMKMTPAESLVAATINAAASLGRADMIGSLAAGKRANFAIFDCGDYRELAYWIGMPLTRSVYVEGARVYPA